MGTRNKWGEVSQRLGANLADFQDSLSEETRQVACTIWRANPDIVSANASLSRSFVRGYMSRICSDQPLPALEPPPFSGGQCDGILYDVTLFRSIYNISNCAEVVSGNIVVQALGPIQGVSFTTTVPDQTTTSCNGLSADPVNLGNWVLSSGSPDQIIVTNAYVDPAGNANPPLSNVTIVDVVRNDGQPDTCGDLPVAYPTTSPNLPDDFIIDRTVTIEDGFDLDLTFFYNIEGGTFPMNFEVNGIKISLDLGGINFNFSPRANDGGSGVLPDGQPAPLPAPDDNLNVPYPPPLVPSPNDDNYDEEERTETDPKDEEVGLELEFVRVTITSFPANTKNQWGDGAPDVYYLGWFQFRSEGFYFPRQPIHFLSSLFKKPAGATGYAYTLYTGVVGKATIYKLKQEATI